MKKMFKFIFLGIIIAIVIFGKQYIDKKTFKYEKTVDECISNYFINSDSKALTPLSELLDKYSDDEDIVYNIQSYSSDVIWSWFAYIDEKYECNRENLNSCKIQLEEFQRLTTLLNNLYATKTPKNQYTLMLNSSYNTITTEVNKKIPSIEKAINSPSAKNPLDSEQTRQKKCSAVQDCTSCRDGVCTCTYTDGSHTEEIRCNKDID